MILVTNNSTKSRQSYIEKCKKLGFDVTREVRSVVYADFDGLEVFMV